MWERSIDVVDDPKTTDNALSRSDDPRYPRPTWLRTIRWVFIRWWSIPLTCVIIYILFAAINLYQLCFLKCSKTCLQHCRTCFTADRFTLERARAFRSTGEFVSR